MYLIPSRMEDAPDSLRIDCYGFRLQKMRSLTATSCNDELVHTTNMFGAVPAPPEATRWRRVPPLHVYYLNTEANGTRDRNFRAGLRAANVSATVTRVQGFPLFHSSGSVRRLDTTARQVLLEHPYCRSRLSSRRDARTGVCVSATCTPDWPSCCLKPWWTLTPSEQRGLSAFHGGDFLRNATSCEHSNPYDGSYEGRGERACATVPGLTLGFLKTLRLAAKAVKPHELAIVLEDDALPQPRWRQRLERFLRARPPGTWDVAKLHGRGTSSGKMGHCGGLGYGNAALMMSGATVATVAQVIEGRLVGNHDLLLCFAARTGKLRMAASEAAVFLPAGRGTTLHAPSQQEDLVRS